MVKDAEENAEADKQRREESDLRNEADSLVFQVEKQLLIQVKTSVKMIKIMQKRKEALKSALEGEDIDDIKAKKKNQKKVVQDLSAKVYEQAAQAQQQAQGEQANGSDDSNVEDADFTEVNEDDNKDDKNKFSY